MEMLNDLIKIGVELTVWLGATVSGMLMFQNSPFAKMSHRKVGTVMMGERCLSPYI